MLVSIHKHLIIYLSTILFAGYSVAQEWNLDQILDSVLHRNRSILIEQQNTRIQQDKYIESRKTLLPKLLLVSDYKYYSDLPTQLLPLSVFNGPDGKFKEAQFGVPHHVNIQAQIQIPIYQAGNFTSIELSKQASLLSEINQLKTKEQVYIEVSLCYFQAQILARQLEFIDSNLINITQIYEITSKLNSEGLAKKTDIQKIQLQIDQFNMQKQLIQNQYTQQINTLNFYLAYPLAYPLTIAKEINIQQVNLSESKVNVDLMIVEQQIKMNSIELKGLRRSRLPTLQFIGNYGYTGFGYDRKPNQFFNLYPISYTGLQIQVPIFNAGLTSSKIHQKKLEQGKLSLQEKNSNEYVHLMEKNTMLQLKSAEIQLRNSENQLQFSKEIFHQQKKLHEQGVILLSEVLLSENTIRENQQQVLNALLNYQKSTLALKKIMGIF